MSVVAHTYAHTSLSSLISHLINRINRINNISLEESCTCVVAVRERRD